MAGQIVNRGENTWYVRVFLGRDPRTGKRKFHNKTIHGTKKEAQRYLNGILREIDLGTFVAPSTITINEFLDKWLEAAAKPRVSERTYQDYSALLERYVREPLGGRNLSSIRPLDIQKLYGDMQLRGLSARVVRYTHAVLSNALKQGVKWGMLSRNPAELVELPKQARNEMRVLGREDVMRFLSALDGESCSTLFKIALATGMRPEEYLALQWKDVDIKKETATVQRALIWRQKGGGWYFAEPKTSRSRRTIPLPQSIVRELIEHKRHQNELRLKAGPLWQNHDLVFCSSIGSPLNIPNITKFFKKALKHAELSEKIRLYDLRHTCATLLMAAGENPKVVAERLGHSSVTLTLDVYSHVLPDMQKAATEKLENMLFGGVVTQ